jgi:hypothetical protein
MRSSTDLLKPIVLWQGFRHRWQYNHRANRLGSYVEHEHRAPGVCEAQVVHTAASGTGPDRAEFTDVFTKIQAQDVGFQPSVCEIQIMTVEEKLTPFKLLNKVQLEPELVGKTRYTVVLNGFDLLADGDAQKLMTLVLETSDPALDEDRANLSFSVTGAFRVDCSSPECERIVRRMREERGYKRATSVDDLQRQMENELEDGKRVVTCTAGERGTIDDRSPLLEEKVSYVLQVHYLIVAGNDEDVYVTHTAPISHSYAWGKRAELPLTLLQFRDADLVQRSSHDGLIHWPGFGRSGMDDPAAIHKHRVHISASE